MLEKTKSKMEHKIIVTKNRGPKIPPLRYSSIWRPKKEKMIL